MTIEGRYNWFVNYCFGGWHHVYKKIVNEKFAEFNIYGDVASFDFDQITKMTIASHGLCLRCEIKQAGPRMLKIFLSPRVSKKENDCCFYNHPDLDDLIGDCKKFKERLKIREELKGESFRK